MIKSKDEVDMDYLHYLRAVRSAKKRKERRLIHELKQIWRDKRRIEEKIKEVEKNDKGGKVKW